MRYLLLALVGLSVLGISSLPDTSAQAPAANGVAVHEWGVLSVYNDVDLANADMRAEWDGLPKYVWGRIDGRTVPPREPTAVRAPVIYFHAPQATNLQVKVDFPKGKPAVWWPGTTVRQGREALLQPMDNQPPSSLHWSVQLRPTNAAGYVTKDIPKGHWMNLLRDVKADDVHVYQGGADPQVKERFLYYDGLIPAPPGLAIAVDGDNVSLQSRAKHDLLDVTVVDLRNLRKIRTARLEKMTPESEVKAVKFTERDQTKWPQAGVDELVGQLTAAGLNEDEARSLANVWRPEFFEKEGLGVFYRLPQAVYDQVLPLTVTPTPAKTVRTLLVHHPHCEPDLAAKVMTLVKDLGSDQFAQRAEAQRRLSGLGRAAFVHLVRARKDAKDPEVKGRLDKVLAEFEVEKAFSK